MPLIRSKKDKSKNACGELSIVTTMAILGLFKDKIFDENYRKNTDEDNALPEGNETIDIEFIEVK